MSSENGELIAEMRALRDRVAGVTDLAVAAVDGLLVAADTEEGIDGESLAALAAAALGLARRAGQSTGKGLLHRTVAQFSHGYVVVQPIGRMGLMTVLGDSGMDIARLHTESQAAADRMDRLLTAPRS
ncbi:roadblock/LC7 domain-containing protein [Kitasatospora sp. NPDC085895]|uniref:roadblock/LC7 domain-containing protein n=1 Tax=Kitasatospora sp. NPDC085895 TaxID=3155057 RepID=UPI00344FC17F